MAAFVLHDPAGQAKSIATGAAPSPVPGGLTAVVITDAEFAGLTAGTHKWNSTTRAVEVDTVKAQWSANQQTVRDFIANAAPTLQAIIDKAQVSFTNVTGAQSAMRDMQTDVKNLARGMRRVGRMLLDDYTGSD